MKKSRDGEPCSHIVFHHRTVFMIASIILGFILSFLKERYRI